MHDPKALERWNKGLIANLEHREAMLAAEEAALPFHRPEWGKVSRELRRVRKILREHRAELQSQNETEAEYQAEMAKIRASCSPEEWAYIEEMNTLYKFG